MDAIACRFCRAALDPRDGHRECPSCLGRAHLLEDVDNPCDAALDLPYAERVRRADRGQTVAPPQAPDRERRHSGGRSRKRHRQHSNTRSGVHDRSGDYSDQGHKRRRTARSHGPDEPRVADQQLLDAITSLNERLGKVEAGRAPVSVSLDSGSSRLSPVSGEPFPERDPDELSIFAPGSLTGSGYGSDQVSVPGSARSAYGGDTEDVPLVSRVLTAAKILDISLPDPSPAPAGGIWDGVSQPRTSPVIPATKQYSEMLMKGWSTPTSTSLFNAGCRGLAKMSYPPESGLGDMPPVGRQVPAWTSLGPYRVTDNPTCPWPQSKTTERLLCRTYNAAARAARSGNALAIMLAALRKATVGVNQDIADLFSSAVTIHAQLTRDVGAVMASAMLARRHVWLAQTSLPDNVRRELLGKPVVPTQVFHPDTPGILERHEHDLQTQDQRRSRTGRQSVTSRLGPLVGPRWPQAQGRRLGSWGGRRQDRTFRAAGEGTRQSGYQPQGLQSRGSSRGRLRGRRPGKGKGRQGGST